MSRSFCETNLEIHECPYNNFVDSFSDDSCDDFENKFGHNSGFSLNDVLWTCSNMFSKR